MVAPLVATDELGWALRTSGRPTLLDVRWALNGPSGIEDYRAGHIPGAQFVDLDDELADPPGTAGRHPLPDADTFGAAMRAHGVSAGRGVVVYDAAAGLAAARAWWLLRYFGHPNVRLLDGGYAAWQAEGRPIATGDEPAPPPGDFVPEPGHMPVLDADAAGVLARSGVLLDARAAARFRGDVEPVDPVAGHIPGARSAPSEGNLDRRGHFLSAERLRARFVALGVQPGEPVGAYCGSGVTAAHEVLALTLAGVKAPALYAGSWSNWVSDPARPVARGDDRTQYR
jgi:thiosulfate/3-mercaptopyruvate sulfurtransferase